jgi:ribosomal protein S18 acetylase RimI-like enzyme
MIRQAVPDDLEALLSLLTGFSEEAGTNFGREHLLTGLQPMLNNQELGLVFVAELDNLLVGYAVIGWGWGIESGGREALIDEVFVLEAHRNQGIGAKIITAVIAELGKYDTKTVFLETEAQNPNSRKLYENLGFEIEDSVWMPKAL